MSGRVDHLHMRRGCCITIWIDSKIMEAIHFDDLNLLLKAQSKDVVLRLCNEVYISRNSRVYPKSLVQYADQTLSLSNSEAQSLLTALRALVKTAIFNGPTTAHEVASLFPGGFHKNLSELLSKIIVDRLPQWRLHATNNLVFMPRLVDFDWRIDVKTSSDSLSRMAVPTSFLQLQVQEPASEVGVVPPMSSTNLELSRETLETMLDGLGKIRDQLSSVAGK